MVDKKKVGRPKKPIEDRIIYIDIHIKVPKEKAEIYHKYLDLKGLNITEFIIGACDKAIQAEGFSTKISIDKKIENNLEEKKWSERMNLYDWYNSNLTALGCLKRDGYLKNIYDQDKT